MPLYKHSVTGKLQDMSTQQASAYADGVLVLVSEESDSERAWRLRQEAIEEARRNKIEIEYDDDDDLDEQLSLDVDTKENE